MIDEKRKKEAQTSLRRASEFVFELKKLIRTD